MRTRSRSCLCLQGQGLACLSCGILRGQVAGGLCHLVPLSQRGQDADSLHGQDEPEQAVRALIDSNLMIWPCCEGLVSCVLLGPKPPTG